MTLTATDIHDRLIELDSTDDTAFTLKTDTTEADVQTWRDGIDVARLESEADAQIERTAITDLTEGNIGPKNLSLNECIKSRNDDPSDYEAAYVLRADRTFIQYFKPYIGGKEPIPESDVHTAMEDHVADLVTQTINAELLKWAQAEFGV